MLEFTGIGTVLRALGFLYWILAAGLLILALKKGQSFKRKILWASIVVAVFGYLPTKAGIEQRQRKAYAKEAWAYFHRLCSENSGEKIYKTIEGVKSVLVIKPLTPAKVGDEYDQFWYGDPYSASPTETRAKSAAGKLVLPHAPVAMDKLGKAFDFVESYVDDGTSERRLVRIVYLPEIRDYKEQSANKVMSRFGISWEDISTPADRHYWVAGSRLSVIDLKDNSVIAERIGYYIESGFGSTNGGARPWLTSKGPPTTCPYSHDWSDRWFLVKVFSLQGDDGHVK